MPEISNKAISKQVIVLAIPIIFSNLSRVVMGLADMAMVSRLGAVALAATGMGSLLVWVFLSMGIGVRTAVQTVSARRLGQKKYPDCGNALFNGIILASVIAKANGAQVAIMAPTEILANQHYISFKKHLDKVQMTCAILVGGTTKSEKQSILDGLSEGRIDIVIGTHALIQKHVAFKSLGLVIVDEQHRFGVMQRGDLHD